MTIGRLGKEVNAPTDVERTGELIGQMMAALPQDYDLVVTADHGFERVDQVANLNVLLDENGIEGQDRSLGGIATTDDPPSPPFCVANPLLAKTGLAQ
ncbi:alkaline phosphatase family protein [Tunturiibacter empetritectus]|uniref:AlkP superfamily pyrophosphatase or phosphodiesterase n=1 Tax=Tunturiibacter lichenicola TaxID=2051959 RepID=A0A852VIW8_9BACT|nr:alkaline phosphatase family protein [Edaphobacter lichenicola]NYF91560.1 putative AlkP superfamily pyrophosphatase or phosphodiesterase [Edaphobacter lichenicola]